MKKNIEVKEKRLIEKLNSSIEGKKPYVAPEVHIDTAAGKDWTSYTRWDNHGPVQFEEQDVPANADAAIKVTAGKSIDSRKEIEDIYHKRWENIFADLDSLKKAAGNNTVKDTQSRTHVEEKIKGDASAREMNFPHICNTKHYEEVNHPQHYNNYDVEVIDMMEKVFGKEATITFCKLNAFKYRMRAGTKPGQSADKDLNKERWYLDKMNELRQK